MCWGYGVATTAIFSNVDACAEFHYVFSAFPAIETPTHRRLRMGQHISNSRLWLRIKGEFIIRPPIAMGRSESIGHDGFLVLTLQPFNHDAKRCIIVHIVPP